MAQTPYQPIQCGAFDVNNMKKDRQYFVCDGEGEEGRREVKKAVELLRGSPPLPFLFLFIHVLFLFLFCFCFHFSQWLSLLSLLRSFIPFVFFVFFVFFFFFCWRNCIVWCFALFSLFELRTSFVHWFLCSFAFLLLTCEIVGSRLGGRVDGGPPEGCRRLLQTKRPVDPRLSLVFHVFSFFFFHSPNQ